MTTGVCALVAAVRYFTPPWLSGGVVVLSHQSLRLYVAVKPRRCPGSERADCREVAWDKADNHGWSTIRPLTLEEQRSDNQSFCLGGAAPLYPDGNGLTLARIKRFSRCR